MRVAAWMCDRCGRMMPGDNIPDGWLHVTINSDTKNAKVFCSDSCAGLWFKPGKKTAVVETPSVVLSDLTCEECGWAVPSDRPLPMNSLALHRRRKHGDMQGSPATIRAAKPRPPA